MLRDDDHVLSERAVELVSALVVAHPDLVAVAVLHLPVRRFNLLFRGGVRPGFAEDAPAFPHAAVEVKLAELGRVLQRQGEPPAALFHALRADLPLVALDVERLEQARLEVFHQRLPCATPQDGGEHIGVEGVVFKRRARLKLGQGFQEHLRPVSIQHGADFVEAGARAHREQMAHRYALDDLGLRGRHELREDVRQPLVEREEAFVHRDADGCAGDALAHGIEHMRHIQPVGRPGAFRDDLAVAHHEHGVGGDGIHLPGNSLVKAPHRLGAEALGLRRAAGQRLWIPRLRQRQLLQRIAIGGHVL